MIGTSDGHIAAVSAEQSRAPLFKHIAFLECQDRSRSFATAHLASPFGRILGGCAATRCAIAWRMQRLCAYGWRGHDCVVDVSAVVVTVVILFGLLFDLLAVSFCARLLAPLEVFPAPAVGARPPLLLFPLPSPHARAVAAFVEACRQRRERLPKRARLEQRRAPGRGLSHSALRREGKRRKRRQRGGGRRDGRRRRVEKRRGGKVQRREAGGGFAEWRSRVVDELLGVARVLAVVDRALPYAVVAEDAAHAMQRRPRVERRGRAATAEHSNGPQRWAREGAHTALRVAHRSQRGDERLHRPHHSGTRTVIVGSARGASGKKGRARAALDVDGLARWRMHREGAFVHSEK